MSAHQDRIERSLKRAFKITVAGGGAAPNATDTMTLDRSSAGSVITLSRSVARPHDCAPAPEKNTPSGLVSDGKAES